MNKLTSERMSTTKGGYWSPSRKDDLVQKLGAIEHRAPALAADVCSQICQYPGKLTQEELEARCETCPLDQMMKLIGDESL